MHEPVLKCERKKPKVTPSPPFYTCKSNELSSKYLCQPPHTDKGQCFYNKMLPREIFRCFHFAWLSLVKNKNYVNRYTIYLLDRYF